MSTHAVSIKALRGAANAVRLTAEGIAGDHPAETFVSQPVAGLVDRAIMFEAAASLLETHDDTGISLDNYLGPRELVNRALDLIGFPPFEKNFV